LLLFSVYFCPSVFYFLSYYVFYYSYPPLSYLPTYANQPAEAVDPIEAIKAKILKAVREVPLITNQVGWIRLLNSGIISLDEMIAVTNHISKPTCAPHQTGKILSYRTLLLLIPSASFPVTYILSFCSSSTPTSW
jgi:hypothetical protein